MRAEKVTTSLLKASSALAALVGSGASARIYGGYAPQDAARPYVVYRKLGAAREQVAAMSQPRAVEASIQVLVVADTYTSLKDTAEAVRAALAYQYGTVAGVTVSHITVADEGEDEYDDELKRHGQAWVFSINHQE